MPERPRFSRFRRLPGLFRTGDSRRPDPAEEPVPLTVYLSGRLLDLAENLAARHGSTTVQEYCEELLKMAIEEEDQATKQESIQVTRGTLQSLDDLANDPDYLTEWTASVREHTQEHELHVVEPPRSSVVEDISSARDTVFRHAGLGDDADFALLPCLRRGEMVSAELADDLIDALRELEEKLHGASVLDRKLAYILHRLAFEGQILLTDFPSEAASDPSTVERLRRIQESVDRVLSGDDIRYYTDSTHSDTHV